MNRRTFLRQTGVTLGSASLAPALLHTLPAAAATPHSTSLATWADVRSQFILDHRNIQMSQMLLAAHPRSVRDAIKRHQQALDTDPAVTWEEHWIDYEEAVLEAAASYMGCDRGEVGLTGSTTEGMALLLNGFRLQAGDEVLSTTHDHYITDKSVDYACAKRGATVHRIAEYDDPRTVSTDEVVSRIISAISDRTRLVVVTWVHSCTGVKLPVRAIADALQEMNARRSERDRIYLLVDGVHGFGNQAETVGSLGCDFFAAGTHKWIFGPRGTGVVFGSKQAWHMIEPTVPTFRMHPYQAWMQDPMDGEPTFTDLMTPGGFHSFAYRWALKEAFEFQLELGRDRVHARTTQLNTRLKEGLEDMSHVHLHTPLDPTLSAGINCFQIGQHSAMDLVAAFHARRIIASASPYRVSYARLTPCIINTEEEVDRCLQAVAGIKA
ncbi:MAG: aminotransferase class V-fold PLP-dependent enzyme [Saprospiraceae bacterium]|nr:aminotransferase class V-fold PLP-dependent enzyme [Saprospiraceae bacterium]